MILTAAAAAGCALEASQSQAAPSTAPAAPQPSDAFDAGPLSDYPTSGVYDKYREQGIFIIRRAMEVFAMSSICTHRGCKVKLQDDQSYHCFCHGSRYDPDGHVVKGPAKRDLPRLAVAEDARGHLLVRKT